MKEQAESSRNKPTDATSGPRSLFAGFGVREIGLWSGGLAIAAVLGFGAWWVFQPDHVPLLDNMSDDSRAEVLALLTQWRVPYVVEEGNGAVLVPAAELGTLRARLSAHGVPARERVGLELFGQRDQGMSEFSQRINYQRALEGELERTIQGLDEVRAARVHLTLAKSSIFESRRETAKGSVVLELKPERRLTTLQISGIRQLVAAAVADMRADDVVVLDDLGRPLASAEDSGEEPDTWTRQLQLETTYEQRARQLVAGLVPDADLRVSVRLQVNFDKVTSVREDLIPVPDSEAGYLIKGRGPGKGASGARAAEGEFEYAFGRSRAETTHAPGTIEQLHVGVVVGKAITAAEVDSIKAVLTGGLGVSTERGDTLAVVGKDAGPAPAAAEQASASARPDARLASTSPPQASAASSMDAAKPRMAVLQWMPPAASVLVMIFGLTMIRRARRMMRNVAPVLTAEERQQLLTDARRWLGAR